MTITYFEDRELPEKQVTALYRAHGWSAADDPAALVAALNESHAVFTAWSDDTLVGLGNALSDGNLVVYYPHLLVLPEFQRRGIAREIMQRMFRRYSHLHQQILAAEPGAVDFYKRLGFVRAGETTTMEIYRGSDH